jgi:hypothetical protein
MFKALPIKWGKEKNICNNKYCKCLMFYILLSWSENKMELPFKLKIIMINVSHSDTLETLLFSWTTGLFLKGELTSSQRVLLHYSRVNEPRRQKMVRKRNTTWKMRIKISVKVKQICHFKCECLNSLITIRYRNSCHNISVRHLCHREVTLRYN